MAKLQLHGAQSIPFQPPLKYPGGIFGGPSIVPRQGIFKVHYAMPEWVRHDNTIGGPLDLRENLPDRCIRASGAPVVGLRGVEESASGLMRSPITWAVIIGLGIWGLATVKGG